MLNKLLHYIFGTVCVTVECRGVDKLLTTLVSKDIRIYNITKSSPTSLSFECYKKTYKKVKKVIDSEQNVTVLYKEQGLPSVFLRYKHRWGIAVGIGIYIVLFYVIGLFVWDIKVIGCESITEQEVMSRLAQNGFSVGVLKRGVDATVIENAFLYGNDKVSWISINIKGTSATVEIREKGRKVEYLDTSKPSNIYASRDGIIASVKAFMGYPVVNVGDTVTAGDIIVSGEYTDKYGKEYKLHSYAEIMAYTTHTKTVTVPYKTTEQQKTGKIKKYYKINLIRLSVPLYFNKKIIYNNYSENTSVKKFKLGDDFYLPISIEKKTYTETENITYMKSKEAALADAYEQLADFESSLVGITVDDKSYDVYEDDSGVTVKLTLDCYENIGIEKNI